jgi:hypothetical protein
MCRWKSSPANASRPGAAQNGAASDSVIVDTKPLLAHRLPRLEKDMPFTHSSVGTVLVGTIWPPGHMQNE